MRKYLYLFWHFRFTFILLLPVAGMAQSSTSNEHYGYLTAGGGTTTDGGAIVSLAGGADLFVYRQLAVSGELGAIFPPSSIGSVVGVLSPNLTWYLRPGGGSGRVAPFITGGYSLIFRQGTINGLNFGGGLTWWFKEGLGLRVEARDYFGVSDPGHHLVQVRAGLAFR
ncbi:MAG: hypothetical protein ACKOB4_17715 [Acidobacteriota bacterium]